MEKAVSGCHECPFRQGYAPGKADCGHPAPGYREISLFIGPAAASPIPANCPLKEDSITIKLGRNVIEP